VVLNDIVGWSGTSKKTFVRRCSSRFDSPVSIDATSTSTVTFDSSGRSAISMTPSKALKRPRTLARPRWRTANSTAEWEASMAYVPGTGSSAPSTMRVRGAWAWVAVSVMVRSLGQIARFRSVSVLTRLEGEM
jgi:hypothetical protein